MTGIRILFRCDGGATEGLGHLSRCLALARHVLEVDPKAQVTFWGRYDSFGRSLLERYRIAQLDLPTIGFTGADGPEAAKATSAFDIVVLDSYALEQGHVDGLADRHCRLALLDDLHALDLRRADLVACFRAGAEDFPYGAKHEALGLRYLVVSPEMRSLRLTRPRPSDNAVRRVLVFLSGGNVDPRLPPMLVQAVGLPGVKVRYVGRDPSLLLPAPPGLVVEGMGSEIHSILADTDFVLCGGGLVKYESAYLGIPNGCVSQTDLQHQDTLRAAALGLTADFGPARALDPYRLRSEVAALLSDPVALDSQRAAFCDILEPDSPRHLARLLLDL